MSESKHTPGPWHQGKDAPVYKGGPDYLNSLHIFAAPRTPEDNDTEIAWVCCRDDGAQDGSDAPRLPTARFNARLIAAAPAMYEYIESSASSGCATAKEILEKIHGNS